MEQSELRASRSVLRTLMNESLNERQGGFELRLRFRCVAAYDIDAALKIAFRQRDARLRSDRVERGVRQGLLCAARIPVHQVHIPACESDHAIRVEVRRQRLQRGLNRRRAAFPEKLNVGALYFDVERIGKKGKDAIHSFGCGAPIAQTEVRLRRIIQHNRIAWIDLFGVLISDERLLQIPTTSKNCRGVQTDV